MFHSIARLSLRYSSRLFFSIGLLVAVIGCGSNDSSNPESGYLQVINGLNDSPDLKLELCDDGDDLVVSSESLDFRGHRRYWR